jgi:hypothetical protein
LLIDLGVFGSIVVMTLNKARHYLIGKKQKPNACYNQTIQLGLCSILDKGTAQFILKLKKTETNVLE